MTPLSESMQSSGGHNCRMHVIYEDGRKNGSLIFLLRAWYESESESAKERLVSSQVP